MSEFTKEGCFLIAEGGSSKNELYVFMEAKNGIPAAPKIIYDGQDHAIFMRNSEQKIILDYINPEIREKLRQAYEVIVVETLLEDIKETYFVSMQMVDIIPVNWNNIGLKTWEEAALGL